MAELRTESSTTGDEPADRPAVPSKAEGAGQPEGGRPRRGRGRGGFWTELPVLVLIALVLAILLKTFVVQAFYIPSSSMEPTLQVGDRVLVTKTAYLYREPMRGEVVVFTEETAGVDVAHANVLAAGLRSLGAGLGIAQAGERDFIKRIIGLPGDTVELRAGRVYINGEALPEAPHTAGGYLSRQDLNDFGPVTVQPNHYFMLGDNRPNSADSRFGLGQIHRDQILGRAFVTLWPVTSAGSLPIPAYGP
ncbi:MAG TPA: signal peptidase I [Euzebya sp.]|nr:signal peptidase I [Euzebya sp.]